jgi:rSAM/selenodomain-associated transferase 2
VGADAAAGGVVALRNPSPFPPARRGGVISIVLITLNEAPIIAASLRHVHDHLAADGPGELIVSDGGSRDGTAEIAASHARVVVAPGGRGAGLNAGAAAASGEILLFLHADTRLPVGALSAVRRAFAERRVVGGRFKVRLDNPRLPYRIVGASINLRDRLLGGFTGDQAVFVRRSVFDQLGGYAPMPLMEDLDFARRLTHAGRVVRLPHHVVTSARRWERHGLARTILRMWTLRSLYYLGVPPRGLAPHYADAR